MPQRIQLSRRKGWRMPANTVRVCRPSDFGNPWRVMRNPDGPGWLAQGVMFRDVAPTKEAAQACAVQRFKEYCPPDSTLANAAAVLLRGKNLGCWCRVGTPCHGDYLLRLANGGEPA